VSDSDNKGGLLATIKDAFSRRDNRLAALEARLAALESRSLADSWKGPHRDGTTYERGALAQRSGACWLSLVGDNTGIPGQSETWKMISKSHR
jgi:hypothetical protein